MLDELTARLEANLEAARAALDTARAEPWVEGSMGQLKPHPGFAVAARCDATALKLVAELRLLGNAKPVREVDPFADLLG